MKTNIAYWEVLLKILPKLKKTYSQNKQETNIEIFLGVKGQKTAYDILLSEANKDKELIIVGIAEKNKYPKEVIDLLRFYVYKRRKELKLKVKKIADPKGRNEKNIPRRQFRNSLFTIHLYNSIGSIRRYNNDFALY